MKRVILLLLCLVGCLVRAQKPPKLASNADGMAFLSRLLTRYPEIPFRKWGYDFDDLTALEKLDEFETSVSSKKAALFPKTLPFQAIQYVSEGDWKEDLKQIEIAKLNLIENLHKLGNRKLSDLVTEWNRAAGREKEALFGLLPLLFDDKGKALHPEISDKVRVQLDKKIRAWSGSDLWKSYIAPYYESHIPRLAESAVSEGGQTYKGAFNELVEKTSRLRPVTAVRPVGRDGQAVPMHTLSLEEMSPYEALARSYFTEDCASYCGLTYPIDAGVKFFAIRKSWNRSQMPVGWVVTAPVSSGFRRGIFLDAAGADLSSADLMHATNLIKEGLGAANIYSRNYNIKDPNPNSDEITGGFKKMRDSSVDITPPRHWDRYAEATRTAWSYDDLLDVMSRDQIKRAWQLKVPSLKNAVGTKINSQVVGIGYEEPRMERLPYFTRAAYAGRLHRERELFMNKNEDEEGKRSQPDELDSDLAHVFHVDEGDVKLFADMTKVVYPNRMRSDDLAKVLTKFPEQKNKIFDMSYPLSVHNALVELHTNAPDTLPEKEWKTLFKASTGLLRKDRAEYKSDPENFSVEHALNAQRTIHGHEYMGRIQEALFATPKEFRKLSFEDFGIEVDKEKLAGLTPLERYHEILRLSGEATQHKREHANEFFHLFGVEKESIEAVEKYLNYPNDNTRPAANEARAKLGISLEAIKPLVPLEEYGSQLLEAFNQEKRPLGSTVWKKRFKEYAQLLKDQLNSLNPYHQSTPFQALLEIPSEYNPLNWKEWAGTFIGKKVLPSHLVENTGIWHPGIWAAVREWTEKGNLDSDQLDLVLYSATFQPDTEKMWKRVELALERTLSSEGKSGDAHADSRWLSLLNLTSEWPDPVWAVLDKHAEKKMAIENYLQTNLRWPEKYAGHFTKVFLESSEPRLRLIAKKMGLRYRPAKCNFDKVAKGEIQNASAD